MVMHMRPRDFDAALCNITVKNATTSYHWLVPLGVVLGCLQTTRLEQPL